MFINYGDRNFFENGMLVDTEHSDCEFQILYCRPYADEQDKYQFAELNIDLTDQWLTERQTEVLQYIGQTNISDDPVRFAIGAVEYFGPENFGAASNYAYNWQDVSKKEICEILRYRMIDFSQVDIDWYEDPIDKRMKDLTQKLKNLAERDSEAAETLLSLFEDEVDDERPRRDFIVQTPEGKLRVWAKTAVDDPEDFPGVYIDLLEEEEDSGYSAGELICAVEYESVDKNLQICSYTDLSSDEPTSIEIIKRSEEDT